MSSLGREPEKTQFETENFCELVVEDRASSRVLSLKMQKLTSKPHELPYKTPPGDSVPV
jgi:hypothetical protein